MRTSGLGQIGHVVAAVNPFEAEQLAELRARSTGEAFPLGSLPLVVITRGRADESGGGVAAREVEHRREQATQAALSRRATHVIAERSGHHVQLEDPELVSRTIEEMVRTLRK